MENQRDFENELKELFDEEPETEVEKINEENKLEQKIDKTGKFVKKHKIIGIVVILLAILLVFRVASIVSDKLSPSEEEAEVVTVQTAVVKQEDISSTAPLTGRILPAEEVAIVPLASGRVTAVNVEVGDYVYAGTVLFEIDSSQIIASYNQAKAAYNLASNSYNNMTILYNAGAISKSAYDQAYTSYIAAQETLNSTATLRSNYSVTAPISGYVTSLNVSVGSIAGQSSAGSVADTSVLTIDTTVSENLSSKLYEGEEVEILVSSLGDSTYNGTITQISPAPAYGTLTYPVTITINDESGDIKAGMFAEVRVTDKESKNALCIPSDAVITKSGENVVVILDKENIPTYVPVKTGIDNGEKVEILSGLKKGDVIVSSGQQYITEGTPVNVSNGKTSLTNKSDK